MSQSVHVFPEAPRADQTNMAAGQTKPLANLFVRSARLPNGPNDLMRDFRLQAALTVDCVGNNLKVGGIDTRRYAAEMVDDESLGNGSDLLLVHGAVSGHGLSAKLNTAVAELGGRCLRPDPAWGDEASILLAPQVRGDCLASLEIADMSANEPHRLSGDVSVLTIGHRRDGRGIAATTLAEGDHIRSIPSAK